MSTSPAADQWVSMDAFRGLTIAGMILVLPWKLKHINSSLPPAKFGCPVILKLSYTTLVTNRRLGEWIDP